MPEYFQGERARIEQAWVRQAVEAGMIKTSSVFTDPVGPGQEPASAIGLACASVPPKENPNEQQRGPS